MSLRTKGGEGQEVHREVLTREDLEMLAQYSLP